MTVEFTRGEGGNSTYYFARKIGTHNSVNSGGFLGPYIHKSNKYLGHNSGNYENSREMDTHNSVKCQKIVKMIPIIP